MFKVICEFGFYNLFYPLPNLSNVSRMMTNEASKVVGFIASTKSDNFITIL